MEEIDVGDWIANNWSPLLTVFMFGWLLWENRALRSKVDEIDKRLVHVETIIDERIPRRPAEAAP